MASGPHHDARRGTWSVKWHDGTAWRRSQVAARPPSWRPGDPPPRRPPPEALAGFLEYAERERVARAGGGAGAGAGAGARPVAQFLEEDLATAPLSPASRSQARFAYDRFAAFCAREGVVRVAEVTPRLCRAFLAELAARPTPRGRPPSAATVRERRARLAAAWGRARALGELAEDPWGQVPPPDLPQPARRPSFTPEQYRAMHAAAPGWLADLLLLGCHTGLRITALATLTWGDVEGAGAARGLGWIVVRPEHDKAGRGYRVPMAPAVHAFLAARRAGAGAEPSGRILAGPAGGPVHRVTSDRALRRAAAAVGLDPLPSPNHAMRRTFGRWAVVGHLTGRPVPVFIVSRWLGHASITMTMRYLDLADDESQDWMSGEPGA